MADTDRQGPMVVACLAPADRRPEVDDLTGSVRADDRRADLTPADAAALEYAFRVADAWSGWVLAVAVGPPAIEPVLAEAAALGADAVLIATAGSSVGTGPTPLAPVELAGDPHATARALASTISSYGDPSLVICGDRSASHGVGAVPALLADALGLDQVLGLVALSVQSGHSLQVERRLDGGWRERLAITGPAVVSVEAAGVHLRRASLSAALSARPSSVTRVDTAFPGHDGDIQYGAPRPYRPRARPVAAPQGEPRQRLLALTGALSVREPPRIVGPLNAAEAADELLRYLERSGITIR